MMGEAAVTARGRDASSDRPGEVDISIIMPCLNEAATIEACIDVAFQTLKLLKTDQGFSGEVIVADNGSTDGSQDLAINAGARVVQVDEKGYGAALRGGFAASRGRYLVMGDSDMSYDFREAAPMITALAAGADLCMGNRFRGEIKQGAMPWKNRYIGNPGLSAILRTLFRTRIGDSHCGLRAITSDAYKRLKLTSEGMEFASEMVLKAALLNLRIEERPVTLAPDGRERPPHLNPWRDGLRHLFYMFLLSPTWLFMAPAILMGGCGLFIMVLLIANPDAEVVRFGAFGIGDHWAIVGSSALIIAVQTMIVGSAAMLIGFREGYIIPSSLSRRLVEKSGLGGWLLAGLLCFAAGLGWAGTIAAGWAGSGFGALNEIRTLIAAFTLMVIGVQVCFGGFLISIAAGNKLKHRAAL